MKRSIIITHLCAAIIISGILLLIYAAVQQTYRSGANDPQVQIARDIAAQVAQDKPYLMHDTINLSNSLSPFIIFYDNSGKPVQSSGYLDGRLPQVPQGVLEYAKTHGEDWVTWQPRAGVRMAVIVKSTTSPSTPVIAVGRSLAEVENRVADLTKMVLITWIACMIVLTVHFGWNVYLNKPAQ